MNSYYLKGGGTRDYKKTKKIAGIFLILFGFCMLIYFFLPLVSYQLFLAGSFSSSSVESPIPKYLVVKSDGFGSLIAEGINSLTKNYHDARNWYPQIKPAEAQEKPKMTSYLLSIPKLKIENASVSTVDYDLDNHLVQYLGTSVPGDRGTAVIFGHSTIPAWFDPNNYKAIFATLHTIKIGDEISTTVEKVKYKYKIFSIVITAATDTNILSQSYDNSYLTIVTCTPPGTTWKRLVVRAALESVEDNSI